MNFDQSMLLCSVFIPMIASLTLLLGICKRDDLAVKIAYVGFGLPCIIGIYLFFRFDPSIEGYNFAILFAETGLHEINVSFHLGLNGGLFTFVYDGWNRWFWSWSSGHIFWL